MGSRKLLLETVEHVVRILRRTRKHRVVDVEVGRFVPVAQILNRSAHISARIAFPAFAGKFLLEGIGSNDRSLRRFGDDLRFFRFAFFPIFPSKLVEKAHSITGLPMKIMGRSDPNPPRFLKSMASSHPNINAIPLDTPSPTDYRNSRNQLPQTHAGGNPHGG